MSDLAGLLSIVLLAGVAGWTLLTIGAWALARLVEDCDAAPAVRRARAAWLVAMPLAGLLLAVLVVLLPAVLKGLGLIADHCLAHGLHHPHICFTHLPAFAPGRPLAMVLVAGPAAGAVALGGWALRQRRDRRLAQRIDSLANSHWAVLSVEVAGVQAFLLGPGRPRIVLSRAARRVLSPDERRAVVRHEIAHARAGDPRRKCWLEFLLALHPPPLRRSLRARWQQAVEEMTDDRVAAQGGGFALAQALVKAVRQQGSGFAGPGGAMAVTAADLERRVRRLTGEGHGGRDTVAIERWLWLLPAAAAAWTVAHHHALEHLLHAVLARAVGG